MDEKRLEGRLALLKTVLLFFKEKELLLGKRKNFYSDYL